MTETRVWFCRGCPDHLGDDLAGIEAVGPELESRDGAVAVMAGSEAYDAAAFDALPALRHVARIGIGVDAVDLDEATRRGVIVTNTPDGPTTSTAEHTVALMMAVAHELKGSAARLQRAEGGYISSQTSMELDGQTLGLIGYGRIGQAVARMAAGIGMKVIVSDPLYQDSVSVDDILSQSHVVSLHVPATPATIGMIDASALARMRPGSILINCARGSVVDTDALVDALRRGHLMGAGLDVTEPEPLDPDHPLLHMENVLVTPHIASNTTAGRVRMERMAFEQIRMVLDGARPTNLVNTDVWKD